MCGTRRIVFLFRTMYIIFIYETRNKIVITGNSQLLVNLAIRWLLYRHVVTKHSQDFKYFYVSALLHKNKLRVSMTASGLFVVLQPEQQNLPFLHYMIIRVLAKCALLYSLRCRFNHLRTPQSRQRRAVSSFFGLISIVQIKIKDLKRLREKVNWRLNVCDCMILKDPTELLDYPTYE